MVNFGPVGPVTPGFKKVKGVHPLVDQQFGYIHLAVQLLDLAVISTKFSGAITTKFCFTYFIR